MIYDRASGYLQLLIFRPFWYFYSLRTGIGVCQS